MKNIGFLIAGLLFGIILVKAEVLSWFRIQEMFHFKAIHMYGIIGTAVVTGIIFNFLVKRFKLKSISGQELKHSPKPFNKGTVIGALIFGIGWAITGACPGPIYAQIGAGALITTVTLLGALLGTFTYGLLQNKLPH